MNIEIDETKDKTLYLAKIKFRDNTVIYDFGNEKYKVFATEYSHLNFNEGEYYSKDDIKKLVDLNYEYKIKKYLFKLLNKNNLSINDVKASIYKKFGKNDISKNVLKEIIINEERDIRFAEEYFEYLNSQNYGKYFILNFLKKHGISDKIIENLEFNNESEHNKCRTFFESIKHKYVSSNYIKQKRKLYDLMLLRGFDVDCIVSVLDSLKIDEQSEYEKLKKDYEKYKYKYSSRYVGAKLKDKVINALINKGYSFKMIYEIIAELEEEDAYD